MWSTIYLERSDIEIGTLGMESGTMNCNFAAEYLAVEYL